MSNSSPVSYPALKFFLKYLDPSLRFQLCTRCPSIQNLEKSVPLYIKHLKLKSHCITVNQSAYELTVFDENRQFKFDFNQLGSYYCVDNGTIEQDPNEVRLDEVEFRTNVALQPPANSLMKLEIGSSVEVLSYQRKMHEAMKYMIGKLFGGKTVKVNQLAIGCENILRIPCTVKFHVKILEILDSGVYSNLEAVCSIIEDSSLPLNAVKSRLQDFITINNRIIQSAKVLYILAEPRIWPYFYIEQLTRHINSRVHIELLGGQIGLLVLSLNDWFTGVHECWRQHEQGPGTRYTFEITEGEMDNVLGEFRKSLRIRQAGNFDRITVDFNETSNVVLQKLREGNSWILEMKLESR